MTTDNEQVLLEPPPDGTEVDTLIGSLERQRRTFAWKCGGLDAAGLRATTAATKMTLGGLLKHLALVEADYFTWKLLGQDPGAPWNSVDWDADPDWEWHSAADDSPEELYALWQAAVERSRASMAEALTRGDLGQLVHVAGDDGEHANLRRMVVDLIDEYARHNGQADLIRESVDGLVGEDPPRA